ncbi:hypothetical protein [Cypionkella sp.]|uniref:hypothetical protein n=1 Tax=Cypionkella sp. TaxID=2811411 RepID=UPI002727E38A|nr:hypothetical protein [Cypionkella sp.]MDO8986450.1 hypothetical protein [Cypionkella sp.]MDP1577881.1 hypothetical protein [Cypionkella sp.]MDP2048209.1 hypothetical protein [Cypionkella sp.]
MDSAQLIFVKQFRPIFLAIAFLALGACTVPIDQATDKSTGFLKELPEGVALIAAPYQNLQEVILKREDSCYWYRHVGPVETTMLPLRSVHGRPICTDAAAKTAFLG